MNLYLVVLIDINVHNHLILPAQVRLLKNVYFYVGETFLLEVGSDNLSGTVDDVLRNLVTLHQTETLLQILTLAFLHTVVVDFGNTGLLTEVKQEPSLVATHFLHFNLDF